MVRSVSHDMLPIPTPDEASRQRFIVAFKQVLTRELRSTQQRLFDEVVAPQYARQHGHRPQTRAEIRAAMTAHPAWRSWSSFARAAQEQMWRAVSDTVFRERARLAARAAALTAPGRRRGSLTLDPSLVPPRGMLAVDVHLQTGGYLLDLGSDDVSAGALYEVGGNLYAFGNDISRNDSKARHVQAFLRERFPALRPRRILDMGCSAGAASVPYALEFPAAEVHAIDVGAAMLRYAHARAEALGAPIHFHQMDCAQTRFPDGFFDLVVSHNLMHEISDATRRSMLRETWRLLAPGGVAVHQDIPLRFAELTEFQRFDYSWDTLNNNEPYWEVFANADLAADLRAAGIPAEQSHIGHLPRAAGSLPWFVVAIWK
ncbi:MAG: class I SAM-dependent methyltransferase [Gammaproteobacteria bacterium]|nr:class I SAM-dependent methyltransferase [Gammaproteobacteria bacterium]